METKQNEPKAENLEENPLVLMTVKSGIPRLLVTGVVECARYCADRVPEKMTLGFLRVLAAVLVIIVPRSITYTLLYPIFRLVFGNLYPAYASYKAVRTKNVKEYVKWMMYWIVFALFTCAETFTDVFFSFWFPFYYEIKTILVVWLLSPATKGSSILYRRFVHPALIRREAEIDEALARATEQGYTAVLHLGSKGVNYATTVLMQTAIKGGGGLVQHLKKSYSLSDLTGEKEDENSNTSHMHDETDMEVEPRRREHVGRRGYSPRRTQSSSSNRVEMYFSEVDVDVRQPRPREPTTSLINIRSSDDISSGYSSGEALQSTKTSQGDSALVRTSSVGTRTRAKTRSTTKKTPEDAGEDSDNNDPPSSKNISFPTPFSHVTPEQALEILLLLSQNSNVADYIKFDRELPVAGNDGLVESTSQSGPTLEQSKSELDESGSGSLDSNLTSEVQIIQSIETETIQKDSIAAEISNDNEKRSIDEQKLDANTKDITVEETIVEVSANNELSSAVSQELIDESGHTVTDELCQNKFDELKQLLSDAHKAVTNIVYTQEKLRQSDTNINESASLKDSDEGLKEADAEVTKILLKDDQSNSIVVDETARMNSEDENIENLDVWAGANVLRSNSDSLGRAGKYHKKPAPKVPLSRSEEDLNECDSQNALKATLVIKTGTLKTFSNTGTAKDVFIAHATDAKSKGKKSKRQRTKEGFSKLLTIPKNIFHHAFHKEHKGPVRTEDSGSNASAAQSRSNSLEPQEMIIELSPKPSSLNEEIDARIDDNSDTSNSSDNYVLASNGNAEDSAEIRKESNAEVAGDSKEEVVNTETAIREMSQSPKVGKKLESDIY